MQEDKTPIKIPSIEELIEMVNQKTLAALNKKIIERFEYTPSKKIRIVYTDQSAENFGSYYECFETFNAKYRLRLEPYFHNLAIKKTTQESVEELQSLKQAPQIKKFIARMRELFEKIESAKKAVNRNVAEIKRTIYHLRKEIAMTSGYELHNALLELYQQDFAHDGGMTFYYQTAKKEIERIKG